MREIGCVDDDEHIGAFSDDGARRFRDTAQQKRQTTDDGKDTHDRNVVNVEQAAQALLLHGRAADAEELDLVCARAQRLHQPEAELIA